LYDWTTGHVLMLDESDEKLPVDLLQLLCGDVLALGQLEHVSATAMQP